MDYTRIAEPGRSRHNHSLVATPPPVPNLVPKPATGSLGSSDLPKTVTHLGTEILQIMLLLGGVIAVLYIIYAGYRYVSAGGDADKAKTARAGIFSAIFGVIIIASAFSIVHFGITLGSFVGGSAGNGISANKGESTDVVNQPATKPVTPVNGTDPGKTPVSSNGDSYASSGPGYSADVLARCTNRDQQITQTSCYPVILNDHDNFCGSTALDSNGNPYTSVYCSGKSNDQIDKQQYCEAILAAEQENGSPPYAECQRMIDQSRANSGDGIKSAGDTTGTSKNSS